MVAGLSLGSPALMHFRLNPKYVDKDEERRTDITFLLCHVRIIYLSRKFRILLNDLGYRVTFW